MSLYRITTEIETDHADDGRVVEYARAQQESARLQGRAASTSVVAVFADARTAGNVVWQSRP